MSLTTCSEGHGSKSKRRTSFLHWIFFSQLYKQCRYSSVQLYWTLSKQVCSFSKATGNHKKFKANKLMHYVSSNLIVSGNTHFLGSLFPVTRMVYRVSKHLYMQRMTARATTLPFPFPFSLLFLTRLLFPQRLIRLMRKKTKTVEQAN